MERVIGIFKQSHCSALAELVDEGSKLLKIRERVPGTLQEEHGDLYIEQVGRALSGRASRRMERESEEGERTNVRNGCAGLGLRGHAPAEGAPSGDNGQFRHQAARFPDSRADRGLSQHGRVRPSCALFHVRELIAQGGDATLAKFGCYSFKEGMGHARPRAMCHHIAS